jgi:FMN phosphatase YigB (HAD superfamily)
MDFRYAILDVDDVLLATQQAEPGAARALLAALSERLDHEKATAVHREFLDQWRTLQRQHWSGEETVSDDYSALLQRITHWQRGVIEQGHEVKPWSRQALLACALASQGVEVSEELVGGVTEAYWQEMAGSVTVHPDAAVTLDRLRAAGCHVHLATDSDGFLGFDESRQTFLYDPEASARAKIRRLRALWRLDVDPRDVTVGDPVGKPSPEFSRRTIADFSEKIGHDIDVRQTVVVGDSLSRDIEPFLRVGVAFGVWLVRERAGGKAPRCSRSDVAVVGSLAEPWHAA